MNRTLSRRAVLRATSQAASLGLLAGCSLATSHAAISGSAALLVPPAVHPAARPPLAAPLQATLPIPDVPLDVKIGQMIMVGFRGRHLTNASAIMRAIAEQHIGSVVLFRYNVSTPDQVTALTATLQSATAHPLLIAIDHEGGLVNRFVGNFGFTDNYSAQELGAQNDPTVTRRYSENIATQLRRFGVNLNLAPVVDLNLNPYNPVIGGVWRSFSADPQIVVAQARAFIEGHHAHGALCTLKHFPGHGSSLADSHLGFVDVTETWQERELAPYRTLIEAGLCDAVMTAHIFNSKLDATYPATLSHAIITGILREKLGYEGVVISDDMQMRAIAKEYDFEVAVQRAIEAGVDILAIANNLAYREDLAVRTVTLIRTLVETGVISAERIDQSYQRIMRLKARLQPSRA
jgi:beta-N-acetylhexosaminidase